MTGDIVIRWAEDIKDVLRLRSFLLLFPLGYPSYANWVEEVCIPEVKNGWKSAVLALLSGCSGIEVIGGAVLQKHKELPDTLHFKSLRVREDFTRSGIASFLIRQVEKKIKSGVILLDFRSGNTAVEKLLLWHGYSRLCEKSLYDGKLDVIMTKRRG